MALLEAEILNKGGYKEKSKMQFNELLNIWFKEHVELNCSKNTQRLYGLEIKNHIEPSLGNYPITDITTRIIQDFLNNKKIEGCGKQAVGIFKNIIITSLSYAVFPLELLENNPGQYVKMSSFDEKKKTKTISVKNIKLYLMNQNVYQF